MKTGKPEVIIIVATAKNRVIGINNTLPWHIREDLQHFKSLTKGYPIIMGRKTYESLPVKPLPHRENIVLSRNKNLDMGDKVFPALTDALEYCKDREKVFVCGGASVYREALDLADTIELTLVHQIVEGDTYFPELDLTVWKKVQEIENPGFTFLTYKK